MAAIIGGSIAGGASLLSGVLGSSGSKSAAKTSSSAALEAAELQYSMYNQTVARLQPWTDTGTAATEQLGGLLGLSGYTASGAGGLSTGALTTEFNPTMSQLEQTPGYQFTRGQGLQAVTNAATGTGTGGGVAPGGKLTTSGPEGQGLASYAENLASTTYQQQFQNYWTQLSNIYNMLSGVSTTGANAAAGSGQAGTSAASSAGNLVSSAGASTAAGITGSTNALTSSLSNVGNTAMTTALISALTNKGTSGTSLGQSISQQASLAGGSTNNISTPFFSSDVVPSGA